MDTTVTIGFITGLITFFIGYLSFMKNRDKDTRIDAHRDAKIESKIDMVISGVDVIKQDLKESEKKISDINEHIIRTDESLKQGLKRLDRIEGKING